MPGHQVPRPVLFGEVLFDEFPDGARVAGGAPFNVAWHLAGFGLDPLLLTGVGEDEAGHELLARFAGWGMDDAGVQVNAAHGTGRVAVELENGQPSYDIVPDRAYDHIDSARLPEGLDQPSFAPFYHGTLAARAPESAAALAVLRERMAGRVFVDVNLREPWWNREMVRAVLDCARWVKLNDEEAALLAGNGDPAGAEDAAATLLGRHELDALILTRGKDGSTLLRPGRPPHRVEPHRVEAGDLADTVGAGDGFCAVCLLGLVRGWELERTLIRATAFASAICTRRGATTSDRAFYTEVAKTWVD